MSRFFVDADLAGSDTVFLDKKETHHATRVMRVKNGDEVDLFDGRGCAARGAVAGVQDGRLLIRLNQKRPSAQTLPVRITLAASVIKPERMELLIQKACELGAYSLIPLLTERTVVKLPKQRWENKKIRWEKIILESAKQSGQASILRLGEITDYRSLISQFGSYDKVLIPTLAVAGESLWDTLKDATPRNLLVLIGPEGDFTAQEASAAISHGAQPVILGPVVLRSETAAIYVLSILNFISINCLTK